MFTVSVVVQVQLRVSEETVKELDGWIESGKFKSRSDAIKTILALYEEKEKTRTFYKTLIERSDEVKENPEMLIPFEDI